MDQQRRETPEEVCRREARLAREVAVISKVQHKNLIKSCVLRVNFHCADCKMQIMQILSSVTGVYSVSIDAEAGTIKVFGEVQPKILVWTLMQSGKHAEVVWANIKHPSLKSNTESCCYGDDHYGPYEYGYSNNELYRHRISVNEQRRLHQQMMRPLPPARYVPGYPTPEYDRHEHDTILCSIM